MGMKQLWLTNGPRWVLGEFAKWANLPAPLRLGYPKKSAFVKMQGRSAKPPQIDPDLACEVQIWLNELEERDYQMAMSIDLFHVRNKTALEVGQILGLSVTKTKETILRAEAWIDCKLNDYFKLTEAQRLVYKMRLKEAS